MKRMTKEMKTDLQKYYKQISKALPRRGRKTLIPDIKASVNSYLAEHPDATFEDVVSYVGTPECIANEYYANQDSTKITKKIQSSRLILRVVISIVLFVLAIFIGLMIYIIIDVIRSTPTYYDEVLEVGIPFEVSDTDLLQVDG